MKRASYREAITWVARNDDIRRECESAADFQFLNTASMIADIFGVDNEKVGKDIARARKKILKEEAMATAAQG